MTPTLSRFSMLSLLLGGSLLVTSVQADTVMTEPGLGEISCLVEPGRQATLSTQVPGVLSSIEVAPGAYVSRGDTLFVLRREAEQASVALENARADYASRRVQRNQRMIERGMLSESERDEIDTELRLARMQVKLANARLNQMTTQAPFDGFIVQRHAEEGEYIDATPVLDIVQLDPLRIEAVLPLISYGAIEAGDSIGVALHAPANRDVTARVERVDRVIDASSATFAIGLTLDNPDGDIPAGINCRLHLP